jgi:hypothetical protein
MAKFNLIFAGYKGEASVHSEAARCFGEVLERELGDDVDFTLFSDTLTQGHKSGDLPGMVTEGEISFCYMATVRFAKFVPECVLFDLPFITNDRAELFGALDGALGDFFKDAMAKATPHKVLGFGTMGCVILPIGSGPFIRRRIAVGSPFALKSVRLLEIFFAPLDLRRGRSILKFTAIRSSHRRSRLRTTICRRSITSEVVPHSWTVQRPF